MHGLIRNLEEIGNGILEISSIMENESYPTDYNRRTFLFSEIDTLMNTLYLLKKGAYKECFILVRTVFEKFFFFWLMLKGRKFRWTVNYTVEPKMSPNRKLARDKTFDLWQNLQEKGDRRFRYISRMQAPKREDTIIVTYEYEGLFDEKDSEKTGYIIPIYNFMLDEYKADWAHLHDIVSITECTIPTEILRKQGKFQKYLYHNFFYFETIVLNLRLNKLINNTQEDMIRIHYNFLSKYTHTAIDTIELWRTLKESSSYTKHQETIHELALLYVIKILSLYLTVFISYYKSYSNANKCLKFEKIVQELERLSSDLWLIEENPSVFDIQLSDMMKEQMRQLDLGVPEGIIPWNNPLLRLQSLRNSKPSSLTSNQL